MIAPLDLFGLACVAVIGGYKLGRFRESLRWTRPTGYGYKELEGGGKWWKVEQIHYINDSGVPDR